MHRALARWFVALCLVLVAGCDLTGKPERFYNEAAGPPAEAQLQLANISAGQHLAGIVSLQLDLASLPGPIDRAVGRVDGEEVGEFSPGGALLLDTRRYTQDEQVLHVDVFLRTRRVGLLALVDTPDIQYSLPLVFDQSPPTAVQITNVSFKGTQARVTWTQNQDENFYAYIVEREPLDGLQGTDAYRPRIDTLFDRSQTTFLAEPIEDNIGTRVFYTVRVWNRAQKAASNIVEGIYGPPRAQLRAERGASGVSPDGRSLYVQDSQDLVEASLPTLDPLRVQRLPGAGAFSENVDIEVDPATGVIYAGGDGPLIRIDPKTLFPDPLGPNSEVTDFALTDEYILTVDFDGTLYALDKEVGIEVLELRDAFAFDYSYVAEASRNGTAYIVDRASGQKASLARVDASTDELAVERSTSLPPLDLSERYAIALTESGDIVVQAGQRLEVLDGMTLARLETHTAQGYTGNASVVATLGDRVFAVFAGPDNASPLRAADLFEFDLNGLTPLRRWSFRQIPEGLTFDRAGNLLVFTPERTWILSL